jgi:tellurite resistance protein TehA-like permease
MIEGDSMKAYIITTGAVFGLIVLAHIWRAVEEGSRMAKDPGFIVLTLFAAALFIWAVTLVRPMRRS